MPLLDVNATPVQVHPSWFDWITVAAIVVGPVMALLVQRILDRIREKKTRRVNLYLAAMAYRTNWLHFESLRALNAIDTIFDQRSDRKVREAWERVIAHTRTPRPDWNADQQGAEQWDNRLLDLRVDLYQLLGAAVGYDHTIDYIKNHFYNPQYHQNVELELEQIRSKFARAITDDGLQVVLREHP